MTCMRSRSCAAESAVCDDTTDASYGLASRHVTTGAGKAMITLVAVVVVVMVAEVVSAYHHKRWRNPALSSGGGYIKA